MVSSGFFNSVNGDRKYTAEEISAIFDGVINDGVFINIGTAFEVKADVGNTVTVGIGRAWLNSAWILNSTVLPIELPESDILTDRIDAVILEVDHSVPVRIGGIKIIRGVASTEPKRPVLEHSAYVNQYPLAYISRPKNSTTISQSDITYTVGTSELPFVTGILQTLNIDSLVAQWGSQWGEWFEEVKNATSDGIVEYQQEWDEWFGGIKTMGEQSMEENQQEWDEWFGGVRDQLDTDAAGHLQNQIDNLKDQIPVESFTWTQAGWHCLATRNENVSKHPFFILLKAYVSDTVNNVSIQYNSLWLCDDSETDFAVYQLMNRQTNTSYDPLFTKISFGDISESQNKGIYIFTRDIVHAGDPIQQFTVEILTNPEWGNSAQWQINPMGDVLAEPISSTMTDYIQNGISPDMRRLSVHTIGDNIIQPGRNKVFNGNIDLLPENPPFDCGAYPCCKPYTSGTIPSDITTNTYFWLIVDPVTEGKIQYIYPIQNTTSNSFYIRVRGGETFQGVSWTKLGDSSKYLPLSGGIMDGNIALLKAKYIQFMAEDVENSGTNFKLYGYSEGINQPEIRLELSNPGTTNTGVWMIGKATTAGSLWMLHKSPRIRAISIDNKHFNEFNPYSDNTGFKIISDNLVVMRYGGTTADRYADDKTLYIPNGLSMGPSSANRKITLEPNGTGDRIQVLGSVYSNGAWRPTGGSNPTYITNSTVAAQAFTNLSSIKVKENVRELTEKEASDVLNLRPVRFDYKDDYGDQNQLGLIAEEVQEIIPEVVCESTDDILAIDYTKLIPHLIKMIQTQQKEIDDLRGKIIDLYRELGFCYEEED